VIGPLVSSVIQSQPLLRQSHELFVACVEAFICECVSIVVYEDDLILDKKISIGCISFVRAFVEFMCIDSDWPIAAICSRIF